MNILITGSEGLIGKELVTRLLNSNHKLICIDLKKKNLKRKNIIYLKKN